VLDTEPLAAFLEMFGAIARAVVGRLNRSGFPGESGLALGESESWEDEAGMHQR